MDYSVIQERHTNTSFNLHLWLRGICQINRRQGAGEGGFCPQTLVFFCPRVRISLTSTAASVPSSQFLEVNYSET